MTKIDIEVQDLPGIGRRYEIHGDRGRISVVLHNTGRRDVYAYEDAARPGRGHDEEEEVAKIVELSDAQARQLGAILGGAYFKPAVVEEVEAVIGELVIDWVTLNEDSPLAGRTIRDFQVRHRTGITIVAIVRDRDAHPMPEADDRLEAGDRLVVVGRRQDFSRFTDLIEGTTA